MPRASILVVGGEPADRAAERLADADGFAVLRTAELPESLAVRGGTVDCVVVALPPETPRRLRRLAGIGTADAPTVVLADDVAVPPDVDPVAPEDLDGLEGRVRAAVRGDGTGDVPGLPQGVELFERSPVGIVLVRDGAIRRANPAAAAVLDRDPADLVGVEPADLVADPDGIETVLGPGVPAGERRRGRFAVGTGGSTVEIEVRARRIAGGSILATVVDVTERTRRRERITALQDVTVELLEVPDAEAVARSTVEAARDVLGLQFSGVFLWNDDDEVLRPSATTDRGRAVLGPPPTFERGEGILGHAFDAGETVALDDARADPRRLDDGANTVRSYVVVPLGDHGALAVASPEVGALDDFSVTVAELLAAAAETALDRIEHDRALLDRERDLREQRDRFSALFENIPDPTVHSVHRDGEPVVVDVNPAFEETFGYDAETIVGEPLDDYVVPAEHHAEAQRLNDRVAAGERLDVEVRRRTVDGVRTFHLRDAPIRVDADRIEEYAIYTDITERIGRERELERQNEQLDAFASVVSHDLRNPLNVVLGATERARETGDLEPLAAAVGAAERMDTLVDDLLSLARQGRVVGEPEPVDLASVADAAWEHAATGGSSGVAKGTLAVDSSATVLADRDRLRELLENLFGNAVDHAGDEVTVTVGVLADGGGFYVADDGPGVPGAERERVFEYGYTTGEDGTGLGLVIVRKIAEAHGWTVDVGESDDGGARFEFAGVELA